MRILGIDYGLKRIGLAIAETQVGLAFARPVMKSQGSLKADAAAVAQFAREADCDLAVVGLPLTPSGKEGEQAKICREFGELLAAEGISVHFEDERYTTAVAKVSLDYLKAHKRRRVVDSEAARLLLVQYLAEPHA